MLLCSCQECVMRIWLKCGVCSGTTKRFTISWSQQSKQSNCLLRLRSKPREIMECDILFRQILFVILAGSRRNKLVTNTFTLTTGWTPKSNRRKEKIKNFYGKSYTIKQASLSIYTNVCKRTTVLRKSISSTTTSCRMREASHWYIISTPQLRSVSRAKRSIN